MKQTHITQKLLLWVEVVKSAWISHTNSGGLSLWVIVHVLISDSESVHRLMDEKWKEINPSAAVAQNEAGGGIQHFRGSRITHVLKTMGCQSAAVLLKEYRRRQPAHFFQKTARSGAADPGFRQRSIISPTGFHGDVGMRGASWQTCIIYTCG